MPHPQLTGLEHKERRSYLFPEGTVMGPITVARIPDNGVAQMSEVTPQLVPSPCKWLQLDEGVSRGAVGPYRKG